MAIRKQNETVSYLKNEEGIIVQGVSANFFGTSADSKPTTNIVNGSFFMEVDTGKTFAFNESDSSWSEIGNGGGGGGGSSDFSTAEVTLINASAENSYGIYLVYINENEYITMDTIIVEGDSNVVVNVPLYKGKIVMPYDVVDVDFGYDPQVTGGIDFNENYSDLIITGDGTLKLKGLPNN